MHYGYNYFFASSIMLAIAHEFISTSAGQTDFRFFLEPRRKSNVILQFKILGECSVRSFIITMNCVEPLVTYILENSRQTSFGRRYVRS